MNAERQRKLPTSREYASNPERPAAILASYPIQWLTARLGVLDRNRRSSLHRDARGCKLGYCEKCGAVEGTLYFNKQKGRWVPLALQVVHLGHNPENVEPNDLAAWCFFCHRGNDKTHQMAASALTLAVEGRLPASRLQERMQIMREAAAEDGLVALGPGGVDLVVASMLDEAGPLTCGDVVAGMQMWVQSLFPGERDEDVQACTKSSLHRLAKRRIPIIDGDTFRAGPAFMHYSGGLCSLRIPLCAPGLEAVPPSMWSKKSAYKYIQ